MAEPPVVVVPAEEYERLSKAEGRRGSLIEFFADSPVAGLGIELERPRDFGRTIKRSSYERLPAGYERGIRTDQA